MDKWLLIVLFACYALTGCKKVNGDLEKYKIQAAIDDKLITKYLADNDLTEKAKKVTDTSGAYYIVKAQGTGNDLFTGSTQITVSDTGRLLTTGKIFQQTEDFHPSFILSQTILGWRLGIPKINKGGVVRLILPSRYAFGPYAQPNLGLPANALLIFDIQLFDVTN